MAIITLSRFLSLFLFFVSALANASISTSLQVNESSFEFVLNTQSDYDKTLISRLNQYSVFEKLHRFSQRDIFLKQKVVYHFDHIHNLESIAAPDNIDGADLPALRILVPYSFLYQLDQGLSQKYYEQEEVRIAIFTATIEKYLWYELGRALMQQFELGFSGNEAFALDNFSTLMLLNISQRDSDYILDATEAFLLLEQLTPFTGSDSYNEEVSLDEERYRKVVCLILGKDFLTLSDSDQNESMNQIIDDLAWDLEKIEACQKLYSEKLQNWLSALRPHLKEDSRLATWH